jgi:hypothetical protein
MSRRVTSIFISYRRQDSAGYTLALARDLRDRFGRSSVFFDVDRIAGGDDFVDVLEREVSQCDALVAVIGPTWLTVESLGGGRRLDDPEDWVGVEVGTALAREILIVPVLVDGALMPGPQDLPVPLARLARRNALVLRHERWDDDVHNLVRRLEEAELRPRRQEAGDAAEARAPTREELQPVTVLAVELVDEGGSADADAFRAECAAVAARAVKPYGGVLQESSSDEVQVCFGLPEAHEDDTERAALSALRIVEQVRDLEEAWGGGGVGVRVGLQTGRATLAAEPDAETVRDLFQEASALGRAVPVDTIALGRAAAARLGRRFQLQTAEPVLATEDLGVWQLIGPRAEPERLTPLVGRREEVVVLRRCLDDLREGRGYILGLIGEAGLGKTRLVQELRAMAGEDVAWLGGRCPSYGATMAYLPVRQALRTFLGVSEGDADAAVRLRLRARIGSLVGDRFDEVRPYLARLLDIRLEPEDEDKVRYLRDEDLADQINRAYGLFVEALASRGPVVVAIEDLQWADSATRALAESLLPVTQTSALLLVADFRPEKDSEAWKLRETVQREYYPQGADERVLRALGEADAQELITSFLGGRELDGRAVATIVDRAGGNPLYLEQLLSTLLESGGVEEARVLRVDAAAVAELPPAIEDLLVARIDQLPAAAQHALQVGAVIGRSFLRRVQERVVELEEVIDVDDLDRALAALKTADLLRERQFPEREYTFTQNMVQEASASTLTPSRRRQLHARVAQTITELFAESLDDYSEALAHHFTEAGDQAKALEYAERAGKRAARLYANDEARGWWERARALASRLDDGEAWRRLTGDLADLHARTGDFAAAVASYRELAAAVTDPDAAARLLAEAAWAVLDADAFAESRALVEEASVAGASVVTQAALELARVRAAWFQGRVDEMAAGLERVEKMATEGLPPELDVRRMRMWDTYLCAIEDYDQAVMWEERLLRLAEDLGDPLQIINAERNLAITRTQSGDPAAGLELQQKAYDLAQRVGYLSELVKVGCNLLYDHYLVGSLTEGMALGEELLPLVKSDRWRIMTLLNLGGIELEAGRTESGEEHFSQALDLASRFGHRGLLAEATVAAATAQATQGRGGEETLRSTLPETDPSVRLQTRRFLAQLALDAGDPEGAEREARAGLEEKGQEAEKVALWRLLGLAQEARQPGTGRQALERALESARTAGRRLEEARALVALSRAQLAVDSAAALASARALFEECGAEGDLVSLEQAGS